MAQVFTSEMTAAWEQDLARARPDPMCEDELAAMPEARSLVGVPLNAGVALRFRLEDGSETDVILNPVAARQLALNVLTAGRQSGWLNDRLEFIFQERPDEDG
jgi:hypothetical protein